MRSSPPRRPGATLLDITLALVVLGVLAAVAVPRVAHTIDRMHVRGAAEEVTVAYAVAREAAVYRSGFVTLHVDPAAGALTVTACDDTLFFRPIVAEFGVALTTTRERSTFAPTGLGWSAANATVVVSRGREADTIVVSRLGRVRHE